MLSQLVFLAILIEIKMILTGSEIIKQVHRGTIFIDPFNIDLVNPNSYNYRLGEYLIELKSKIIDLKRDQKFKRIKIPDNGYVLLPSKFYLGSTTEIIGSDKYVPSLIGRSSLGRLGLFLQITADLGHIGTKHRWTLELACVQPIRIYSRMKIGQVSFWEPKGLNLLKGKKYINQKLNYSSFSDPKMSIFSKMLS